MRDEQCEPYIFEGEEDREKERKPSILRYDNFSWLISTHTYFIRFNEQTIYIQFDKDSSHISIHSSNSEFVSSNCANFLFATLPLLLCPCLLFLSILVSSFGAALFHFNCV